MSQSLSDALHHVAGDIGPLGDIDRALRDVRTRRIRMSVGALAATCLALVLIVLTVPTPTAIGPVEPAPTPPVEVLQSSGSIPSIASSPLPEGADVAAVGRGGFLVWSKGQPRLVAESTRGFRSALSPDGRVLARSDGDLSLRTGTGIGHALVVTDLTSGRDLLTWRMKVGDVEGEAARLVWSGDARRLFVTVIPEQDLHYEYPPSFGELRVFQHSGDSMVEVAAARPLPGMVVGVDEGGSTVLVQDGARTGPLARIDVATGELTRTETLYSGYWGSGGPPQPWGEFNGQGCWDTTRGLACSVTPGIGGFTVTWVDLRTVGRAPDQPRREGQAELPTFAGWLDGDPVVVGAIGDERVGVVRMTATGPVPLRQFDTSGLAGVLQGGAYTVTVPEYR